MKQPLKPSDWEKTEASLIKSELFRHDKQAEEKKQLHRLIYYAVLYRMKNGTRFRERNYVIKWVEYEDNI